MDANHSVIRFQRESVTSLRRCASEAASRSRAGRSVAEGGDERVGAGAGADGRRAGGLDADGVLAGGEVLRLLGGAEGGLLVDEEAGGAGGPEDDGRRLRVRERVELGALRATGAG